MKWHTIWAIFLRNVQSYFSSALGYLIIVVFVFVCSLLAFNEQFFTNNLATLDQLSRYYPVLLLFLVPAITMSVWADERKQSTDELLFTLPASDLEVLLGKYLAVMAVYSIALVFSGTLLIVLARIGNPPWGTVVTTYLGYWLAGAALLAAGMFASSLTRSTTVAFVVGVLVSALPVFLAPAANFLTRFGQGLAEGLRSLAVSEQLRPFTEGLVPLSGILYFVSLAAFLLYLNFVVITRRHWSGGKQTRMGAQYLVRVLALASTLVCFNVMLEKGKAYVPAGVDLSAEKVHTLAPITRKLINKAIANEQPVSIQAFLSRDVPEAFVPVRKQLINLLRQYDRLGGRFITVRFVDVRHASPAETEARRLGIERINYKLEDREGRTVEQDVYLGVVIQGEKRKVVIPHFRYKVQVEYELTRSLGTVLEDTQKRRVGILRTDARVLGMGKKWHFDRFVEELRKQYDVLDVSQADLESYVQDSSGKKPEPKTAKAAGKDAKKKVSKPEVLIVVQATSLPQSAMDNLVKYLQRGNPVIIFDDPLPFYLVYDQSGIDEYFRGPVYEIIDAPRLRRAHPRSIWAIELIPKSVLEKLTNWLQEQMRRRMIRSQQQFEVLLHEGTSQFYPEAIPQVSAMFASRKADGGTAESLLRALGLVWDNGQVVADAYNPHPEFNPRIPEAVVEENGPNWPVSYYGQKENAFLFLSRDGGNPQALNAEHPVTKDLTEVLAIYSGCVHRRTQGTTTVLPLLQTSPNPSLIDWKDLTVKTTQTVDYVDPLTGRAIDRKEEIVESKITNNIRPGNRGGDSELNPGLFPRLPQYTLAADPKRTPAEKEQTIAVLVTSDAKKKTESQDKSGQKSGTEQKSPAAIKAVFVADIDMISDVFFQQAETLGLPLDNMSFVMNAVEYLAGDERFIELRSRRPQPRTLVSIQNAVKGFRQQRLEEERQIKDRTDEQVQKAQKRFQQKLSTIRESKDLNVLQKGQLQVVALRTEAQRLQAEKKQLEDELKRRLAQLKDEEDRQIRQYESRVRAVAVALTPLPALLLGLVVLCLRWINERRGVVPGRRAA